MNGALRTALGVAIGAVVVMISLTPTQATETTSSARSRENPRATLIGIDGKTRTVIKTDTGNMESRVELQPGDTLKLSADRKAVIGYDTEGKPFMTLTSPELKHRDKVVDAEFAIDGSSVALVSTTAARSPRHACPQAFRGNFLVGSVGGLVVCGAAGAANVAAGLACGVGWSTWTSAIDYDHACRRK